MVFRPVVVLVPAKQGAYLWLKLYERTILCVPSAALAALSEMCVNLGRTLCVERMLQKVDKVGLYIVVVHTSPSKYSRCNVSLAVFSRDLTVPTGI